MAAYHFSAKMHGRSNGGSAIRSAAYRSAERLFDTRAGKTEDYTRKGDVAETAILAPEGAPGWVQDRQQLWDRVEAREKRRDAQLAQELEVSLPRELCEAENWRLITDFARTHLVAEGRVCDIAMHMGVAADGGAHPHAHILMPTRSLEGDGFGEKHPDCDWRTFTSRRDRLEELREAWCDFARTRAAELGYDLGPEFDHRSLADRGIDLEAQPKLGATAQRLEDAGTPAERTAEVLAAQQRNGARLLDDPGIAITALTQRQSTFSEAELASYIFRHSAQDQFETIMARARPLAIEVGRDDAGKPRYSSAEMIAIEARMAQDAVAMAGRRTHQVGDGAMLAASSGRLSAEQGDAAQHILRSGDLACLIGYAGAGKSTLLNEARQAWEAQGYRVRGCALSGIAAENLGQGSGIVDARTIASLEYAWGRGRDQLGPKDILVVDEAGMIGSRDLARLITQARESGTKIVLVGDPEQLQAIEAGAAFRMIADRTGAAELTEIRRQTVDWQKQATRELATGQTAAALARYREAGAIVMATTDLEARAQLVEGWNADRAAHPERSRIMLAHSNDDVRALNEIAREQLRVAGQLGIGETLLQTEFGERGFTAGDRLLFRRNDRGLGVRNGTLGTVAEIEPGRLAVTTDDGRRVELDPTVYRDIEHGYATTVHKAQGVTVDQAHVLATRGFDRHLAYVSMSRHRAALSIVASREAFAKDAELAKVLSRERAKDTTLDYDAPDAAPAPTAPPRSPTPPPSLAPAPAPRPTPDFIARHQGPAASPSRSPQAEDAPAAPEPKSEPERQLTDVERAFIQQKNAAPSLADAFRLKRDRGPHLRR